MVVRWFIPLALVLFVACGKGSGGDGAQTPASTPDPLSADAGQAILTSAERFSQNVQSGRAEFNWEVTRDGFDIGGNGDYAFVSPGSLDLEAHYTGEGEFPTEFREENDSRLLVLGESIYLDAPSLHDGWVLFTPGDFGTDWDVARRLISNHSPLDYRSVAASLSGAVTTTGEDSIDGHDYLHYQSTADAGTLMNALADAYGSQGQTMLANRFSGPIPVDIWLDPVTLLPRRLSANGEFSFMDGSSRLALNVDFLQQNALAGFAEAPNEVTPLAELIG